MHAGLREAGCDVEAVPDVYRALARLVSCQPSTFRAIVVCVDRLDVGQFEFFQLASHHRRDTPLYVYAQAHAESKVATALRFGARAAVEPATVHGILPSVATETTQPAVAPPTVEAAAGPAPPSVEPVTQELAAETGQSAAPPEEPSDSDPAPEEKPVADVTRQPAKQTAQTKSTVRVPWLRYDDGPQRTPPAKAAPKRAPEPPATPEPEPPLLSPEELKALIGEPSGEAEAEAKPPARKRGRKS